MFFVKKKKKKPSDSIHHVILLNDFISSIAFVKGMQNWSKNLTTLKTKFSMLATFNLGIKIMRFQVIFTR